MTDRCRKRLHPLTKSNTKLVRHSITGNIYYLCKRCRAVRHVAWRKKIDRERRRPRTVYYGLVEYPL